MPGPGQWSQIEGCPQPEDVVRLFGGWESLIETSGILEYPLVAGLSEFGRALAAQRAAEADRSRQAKHRERELEHRQARLEEGEREMRAQLTREFTDRLERAERDAETARRDGEAVQQGTATALGRAAEADRRTMQAEEDMQRALRRVHALTYELDRASAGEAPVFAAWFAWSAGDFGALVEAVALGIAGGRLHREIVAAPLGRTEWRGLYRGIASGERRHRVGRDRSFGVDRAL
jgi:hypothetical protein